MQIGTAKTKTYWGLASVNNLNLMPHEVKEVVEVRAERLDEAVHEDVLLLKADVEGWEPQVGACCCREWVPARRARTHVYRWMQAVARHAKHVKSCTGGQRVTGPVWRVGRKWGWGGV